MPMLMDVDEAAAALVRGLSGGAFEITFPKAFGFLTRFFGKVLPDRAYIALASKVKPKGRS